MKAPLSSLNLTCPMLAAPMAGGPTTPALVAEWGRAWAAAGAGLGRGWGPRVYSTGLGTSE